MKFKFPTWARTPASGRFWGPGAGIYDINSNNNSLIGGHPARNLNQQIGEGTRESA